MQSVGNHGVTVYRILRVVGDDVIIVVLAVLGLYLEGTVEVQVATHGDRGY